jgi:SAM-dependent methyltransferase
MDEKIRAIQRLWYPPHTHPYVAFETRVQSYLHPAAVILDAGCGPKAPVLSKLAPRVAQAIGVDIALCSEAVEGIELISANLEALPLQDRSVDLIFSRSVLEHLQRTFDVFQEFARILKVGGHLVCLTPNKWDYASLLAMITPNSWHPGIVHATEGRPRADVFPTYYRANTRSRMKQLSLRSGLSIFHFEYLGQYPNYLVFSPLLFRIGCYYDRLLASFRHLHWLRGWILADFVKRHS